MDKIAKTPGYISSLARFAAYARLGIGKMMLEEFFKYAKKYNIKESFLHVRKNNFSAIELYKSFGYKIITTIPYYFNPTDNAHVMRKVFD